MAGLTDEGFIPLTLDEIKTNIQNKLETFNPGFDFSPESPDGQLIEIFSFEISQAWDQLALVYKSFDPRIATGQALRNLGTLSGIIKGNATRSYAIIDLVGVAGTVVPSGSIVSDADGNEFVTEFDAVIPVSVGVVASVPGPIPVTAGTIINIETPLTGWSSISHTVDGDIGTVPETEEHYRNFRTRAVMNASEGVLGSLKSKLVSLGIDQVEILNNDSASTAPDGTPAGAIHISISETTLTDEVIAAEILKYKSLGTYTFGSTAVENVLDVQGNPHTIRFTKAVAVPIEIDLNIKFLSSDNSGAVDAIKDALELYVNSLVTGEDVIWSHMFGLITPHGDAQINSLNIGELGGTLLPQNVSIEDTEFASIDISNITVTTV
jgi:uncharacterized phage protein gp47/JayE